MVFIHVLACIPVDTLILRARLRFDKHNSDLLTGVHAYDECIRLRSDESRGALRSFCEEASITLPVGIKRKQTNFLTEFHLNERHPRDNFAPSRFLLLSSKHGINRHFVHAKLPEPQRA